MRALALLLLSPAQAHRPDLLQTSYEVEDPTVSWVLAAEFEEGDEVFTLLLDYDEPFGAPFELLIPLRDSLAEHRPAYAIVGPGLPEPSEELRALLPYEVPDGEGVFVDWNDDPERYVYFERVMRRTYWSSGTVAVALGAGLNQVWIWSPDGTTGAFQFGFGVEENFGDGAWGPLFANWGNFAW
jgi:hypothetical protein